jgi:hypothetical protein
MQKRRCEEVLRGRTCPRCHKKFFICRHCDRGHVYCCKQCSEASRCEKCRGYRRLVAIGKAHWVEQTIETGTHWCVDILQYSFVLRLHPASGSIWSATMKRGTYNQDKWQREAEKARKKREKAIRREQNREQGPDAVEIISAADVVGNLPSSAEVMRAMEQNVGSNRSAAAIPCRLLVGSLSWDTTEETLRELFSTYGSVTDVVIPCDRSTGRSRGFGFVTFEDRKNGSRAIEQLDGSELDGRRIGVRIATERKR